MVQFTDHNGDERYRLNQRIHLITGTPLAKGFAKYRREICRPNAVEERGAEMVTVTFEDRVFKEPEDALYKMHRWLDSRGVNRLPHLITFSQQPPEGEYRVSQSR